MAIEELRELLKDLLEHEDVVTGCQEDHTALLEELGLRPPPTVAYQALGFSKDMEYIRRPEAHRGGASRPASNLAQIRSTPPLAHVCSIGSPRNIIRFLNPLLPSLT
jgi:hypothetical protein